MILLLLEERYVRLTVMCELGQHFQGKLTILYGIDYFIDSGNINSSIVNSRLKKWKIALKYAQIMNLPEIYSNEN